MNAKTIVFLSLTAAWLLMLLCDWFLPWFVVPDMVFVMWLALVFAMETVPIWLTLSLFTLLLDISAEVTFGFHGTVYGLCALFILPGMRHLRLSSGIEQLISIAVLSGIAALIKGILLYLIEDTPMPLGWILALAAQTFLWPFLRTLAEMLLQPYQPREDK